VNSQALWYLTRGSGIVALLLLTAAVVAGLTTSARWSARRWPRFVVENLHRNVSLLSVIFLAVHISSAVLDSYVSISWIDAVIPFIGSYRPLWLGLGAVALDCFLAVAATSMLRARIGYRTWRKVHWLAYGCWGVALMHGLGIGSDSRQIWMLGLDAAAVAAVAVAVVWRIAASRRPVRLPASTLIDTQGALR
jgi:predicted ferric reductase